MFQKIGHEISFRISGHQLMYVALERESVQTYYFDLASMQFFQDLKKLDQPANLPPETVRAFLETINNDAFLNGLRRVSWYATTGRALNRPLTPEELADIKSRIEAKLAE